MGIRVSKMTFYESCFSFEKSCNLKFNVTRTMEKYVLSQTQEYDYQNASQEQTKFTAAYRLSQLYTFFRRLMTINNLRCLFDIVHHLEEHSVCLVNFRYKVVYIFSRLQTILDVYLQIYSCFIKIQNIKQNKELSRWKLLKSALSIDKAIIRNK